MGSSKKDDRAYWEIRVGEIRPIDFIERLMNGILEITQNEENTPGLATYSLNDKTP
jgi:hypothetical protein